MANFNTNQALHLYVAKAVKTLSAGDDPAEVLTSPGDMAVREIKEQPDGKAVGFQLVSRNGDGLIVASETVKAANVEYVRSAKAEDMRIKLRKATVKLSGDVELEDLKGRHIMVTVELHEFIGPDYSESYPVMADVLVTKEASESEEKLYEAIADALSAQLDAFEGNKPFAVESSSDGVVIKQVAQRWVPGKLQADPVHFDVTCSLLRGSIADPFVQMPWGEVETDYSGEYITGDYRIADMERYSMGERGDAFRESVWPLDYHPEPLVRPEDGKYQYGMLTVRHAYRGGAEDVQKSPRDIHVAASDSDVEAIKSTVEGILGA